MKRFFVAAIVCAAVSLCTFFLSVHWAMEHVAVCDTQNGTILSIFGQEWLHNAESACE